MITLNQILDYFDTPSPTDLQEFEDLGGFSVDDLDDMERSMKNEVELENMLKNV